MREFDERLDCYESFNPDKGGNDGFLLLLEIKFDSLRLLVPYS
jgi:hypothetical protein